MRTIGLLGGMSWHSSADYYRLINTEVAARLGGHHSAECLLGSVDFEQVRELQRQDDWAAAGRLLASAANRLQQGGAELIVVCTNLMHKVAPAIEAAIDVPLLHIADAVGARLSVGGFSRVGLLGTRWVMEETFYRDRLTNGFGIDVVIPQPADRAMIDRVIFDELTLGVVTDTSRVGYVAAIERLAAAGAQAIVLACTEIQLLISEQDSPLPVIDSTSVHALAAVDVALARSEAGRPAAPQLSRTS